MLFLNLNLLKNPQCFLRSILLAKIILLYTSFLVFHSLMLTNQLQDRVLCVQMMCELCDMPSMACVVSADCGKYVRIPPSGGHLPLCGHLTPDT